MPVPASRLFLGLGLLPATTPCFGRGRFDPLAVPLLVTVEGPSTAPAGRAAAAAAALAVAAAMAASVTARRFGGCPNLSMLVMSGVKRCWIQEASVSRLHYVRRMKIVCTYVLSGC